MFAFLQIVSRWMSKCLRNRWGSIDDVEELIALAWEILAVIWPVMYPQADATEDSGSPRVGPAPEHEAAAPAADAAVCGRARGGRGRGGRGPGRGPRGRGRGRGRCQQPGDEEDEDFQKKRANARKNVVILLKEVSFRIMVSVSLRTKRPVRHFMAWADEQQGAWNRKRKAALEAGETYLGKTPVSLLVTVSAEEFRQDISDLLANETWTSESGWAPVLRMARSAQQRADTRLLIVECATALSASWDFRVMHAVKSWHAVVLTVMQEHAIFGL